MARDSFRPSADHKRFADATEALGYNASVAARCREAQVPERKARAWLKDPAFAAWLRAQYWEVMADSVTSGWAAVLEKAREGSMRAAHMFFQRFDPDYVPSERQAKLKDRRARRGAVDRLLELAEENGIPCQGKEV